MATLEQIRKRPGCLVGAIGIALLAFIITLNKTGGPSDRNPSHNNIAVVNGEKINVLEFQQKVEEVVNQYKNQGMTLNEDQTNEIRQMVLQGMINKVLLSEECEKMGFAVSEIELSDLIMGDHISPMIQQMPDFRNRQTNQFDKAVLLQFLQVIQSDNYDESNASQILEARKNWLNVEEQVLEQKLQMKVVSFLTSAITPNKLDAKAVYEEGKVSVDFDYVLQSYNSVPDEAVTVSDAEIAQLYKERKNNFKREDGRLLNLIAVNILPSAADYQNVATKMDVVKDKLVAPVVNNLVTENSEIPYSDAFVSYAQLSDDLKRFVDNSTIGTIEGPVLNNNVYSLYKLEETSVAPDSIHLFIISLPIGVNDNELTHLSDSLINVLKSGTSFADMVKTTTNGQTDGDMGWQTESTLLRQAQGDVSFKNEIFSAPVKEPILLRAAFGNFIVNVEEKTAPVKKYKVATVQITVTPSQTTKTDLFSRLSQYVSKNHTLTAFKDSASAAGYTVQAGLEVAKNQLNVLNIQGTRQVIQWAFKNKKGAISDIFECQNQEYFVVATVGETLKKGFQSQESVSDILKRELLDDKKAEKIISELNAKKPANLEQYAQAMNTTPQSVKYVTFATQSISGGIGVEPLLNAQAPLAEVGKISEPYKGKKGVYVIQLTDKRESEEPYNEASQKQILQMQQYGYRLYQLIQSGDVLKDGADVEDNFDRFY